MEKTTKVRAFDTINGKVTIRYTKVSEEGLKTGVMIAFTVEGSKGNKPWTASIKAEKADLLGEATKLKKDLIGVNLDLEEKIELIIEDAKEVVKRQVMAERVEEENFLDIVERLYKMAEKYTEEMNTRKWGMKNPLIYIEDGYMIIEAKGISGLIGGSNWSPLKLKKELKFRGLLQVNGGRAYDFFINKSKKNPDADKKYLKININDKTLNFKEIFKTNKEEVVAA